MSGETDLQVLLQQMEPALHAGHYVFVLMPTPDGINPADTVMIFREAEGYTLILEKEHADGKGYPYNFVAAWITLTVHSALEAVGLTAAFSRALADASISCNVVAGFYHDHIFVPEADADAAMSVLRSLRQRSITGMPS